MVGQSEGAFGNDLTNVMTPDSQEEIARRFVSFQKKNRFNSESYSTLLSTNATYVQSQPQGDNKADGAMAAICLFQPLSDFSSDFKSKKSIF